ncbi:OmpP1/FadL family transporter [Aegicerativicinus sediminis]|uniref:OmpP1/FadL family transporter n=1 Tax=Aegicerativicinus sediminis TaxID=2893202 RepID=UPI001E4C00BE|nr:porin [Aegicerativicinus sediminis]
MKNIFTFLLSLLTLYSFAQAGHIMQGAGAFNMSMGGAATGQPLDITGALLWNPAGITEFENSSMKFDIGMFFSSPKFYSSVPDMQTGTIYSGMTKDDRGVSPMPAYAYIYKPKNSRHSFGVSAIGISGFGVTFPENNFNPVNANQALGGFGKIESDYGLFQFGLTWAYALSDNFSIAVQPNIDWATLELMPNPTANPNQEFTYPYTNKVNAFGFGAQIALLYHTDSGFKAGISYKTLQNFKDFEFDNTYPNGDQSTNSFAMDYPSILSLGLGYSIGQFDLALDFRHVDYENTDGFNTTGWTQTGSVAGFGWDNIQIWSAGVQYKGIDKLPLRLGYTNSSNPISSDVAFFNIPATAIIKNAFQVGLSYEFSKWFQLDFTYHTASSDGKTSGPVLNPMMIQNFPPYGAVPNSNVAYEMKTSMIMLGFNFKFDRPEEE